jgi:hypothetical protein
MFGQFSRRLKATRAGRRFSARFERHHPMMPPLSDHLHTIPASARHSEAIGHAGGNGTGSAWGGTSARRVDHARSKSGFRRQAAFCVAGSDALVRLFRATRGAS